jgi:ATP-dependent Clp protease ATP-binding subunit ClpA
MQAREIRKFIRREVGNPISDAILQTGCKEYALVCENGEIKARAVQLSAN